MKLNELSEKVGRHASTVSRWINRTRRISASNAVELERATGIDRRAWLYPEEFENPYFKNGTTSPTPPPHEA